MKGTSAGFGKFLRILYSVFAGSMVYLAIFMIDRDARSVELPIIVRTNSEFTSNSNIPRTATIVMKGDRDVIYSIDPDKIAVRLDLSRVKEEGIFPIPLEVDCDIGILNSAKVEIYPQKPSIRVSMIRRSGLGEP